MTTQCPYYTPCEEGTRKCCQWCKYDGYCSVAEKIAGIPVPVEEIGCGVCLGEPEPASVNRVTVSKALWALKEAEDLEGYLRISEQYRSYLWT